MRMIGLLGGMSWESSIEYERLINEGVRARLGGTHSADLAIRSYDFARIEELQAGGAVPRAGPLHAQAELRRARTEGQDGAGVAAEGELGAGRRRRRGPDRQVGTAAPQDEARVRRRRANDDLDQVVLARRIRVAVAVDPDSRAQRRAFLVAIGHGGAREGEVGAAVHGAVGGQAAGDTGHGVRGLAARACELVANADTNVIQRGARRDPREHQAVAIRAHASARVHQPRMPAGHRHARRTLELPQVRAARRRALRHELDRVVHGDDARPRDGHRAGRAARPRSVDDQDERQDQAGREPPVRGHRTLLTLDSRHRVDRGPCPRW